MFLHPELETLAPGATLPNRHRAPSQDRGCRLAQFLEAEADILPFAAASPSPFANKGWRIPGTLKTILQLLINHGAGVRAKDDQGHTTLFYVCMFGHQDLFRKLLQQEADVSTTHDFVSWRQVTNLNLLQTTLEALLWKEHNGALIADRPWKMNLKHRWGQVAIDLLDAGLSCPSDDPRMVKPLQAACFQGDTSWIERLVEYGVSIDMPTVRELSGGRFYACALHAAAAGGQADVVRYLLNRGARPQELGLSTCVDKDFDSFRLYYELTPRNTRKQTALAVAVGEAREAAKDLHVNGSRHGIRDSELEQLEQLVLNY